MTRDADRDDEIIERVADLLRDGVPARPDFTDRVMAAVSAAPGGAPRWWSRLRTARLSLSPLGALAAAAAIGVIAVAGTVSLSARFHPAPTVARAAGVLPADTVHIVRFVFLAPRASSVALVGDFNNWERGLTPLRRVGSTGAWSVSVPLHSGVHQYAFIVNDSTWTPDPATPTTVSDDFGTQTSVIAIGGGAS